MFSRFKSSTKHWCVTRLENVNTETDILRWLFYILYFWWNSTHECFLCTTCIVMFVVNSNPELHYNVLPVSKEWQLLKLTTWVLRIGICVRKQKAQSSKRYSLEIMKQAIDWNCIIRSELSRVHQVHDYIRNILWQIALLAWKELQRRYFPEVEKLRIDINY